MRTDINILRKCCLAAAVVAFFAYGCGPKGGRRGGAEGEMAALSAELVQMLQPIDLADSHKVDTIDFGVVKTGEVVSRRIALTNSGQQPKIVTSTETVCGCLRLDYPKEPIAQGERRVAEMWFDSAGYTFFLPRTFYLRGTSEGDVIKTIVVVARME